MYVFVEPPLRLLFANHLVPGVGGEADNVQYQHEVANWRTLTSKLGGLWSQLMKNVFRWTNFFVTYVYFVLSLIECMNMKHTLNL